MRIDKIKEAVADQLGIAPEELALALPPLPGKGDFALSLFKQAKERGLRPFELANSVADLLLKSEDVESADVVEGYVNITLCYPTLFEPVAEALIDPSFGSNAIGRGKSIMVEYFSPNTNKPLHVGHLRNLFIGEAVSNLLAFCGYDVIRANLYNDRGIHISKAQLAYSKWGQGATPHSLGKKGDHQVGDFYVLFGNKAEHDPDLEEEAQALLRKWEAGDPGVRSLWSTLRDWVVEGLEQTLDHLGIRPFDVVYWESEFWERGVDVVRAGLETGVFRKSEDGAVVIELPELGMKPMLRADGTALYITQDLHLATRKMAEYGPLDRSIYVVAAEQKDHFKALFEILRLLGHEWAEKCYHLGYGMILIRGGKLKSREGITADADQIIGTLEDMAYREVVERHLTLPEDEKADRARKIALSAIKWDFLKIGSLKNINFDPQSSLSLKGDTGPYLLYSYARTRALLRKAGITQTPSPETRPERVLAGERILAANLMLFSDVVSKAAHSYNFSPLCAYLYNLADKFNTYYQETRILDTPNDIQRHRLALTTAIGNVLNIGLRILGIESLEEL